MIRAFEGGFVATSEAALGEYVRARALVDRLDSSAVLRTLQVCTDTNSSGEFSDTHQAKNEPALCFLVSLGYSNCCTSPLTHSLVTFADPWCKYIAHPQIQTHD